jgi:DNA-binding MarR family transcriptional regulator
VENKHIEELAADLFSSYYLIHKKLMSIGLRDLPCNLSSVHLAVMGMLGRESCSISEIARRLAMPKPQMTHLLDHLVDLGMVERRPNVKDRRVINISLTYRGRDALNACQAKARQNMSDKLLDMTPDDRSDLLVALEKLREICSKL